MHWFKGGLALSKAHSQDDTEIRYSSSKLSLFRGRQNDRKSRNESSSSSSSSSPQPLPLPELHVLLRKDPKFAKSTSYNVPLPSPDRDESIHPIKGLKSKLSGQDARTNTERSYTRSSEKSPRRQNSKLRYKFSIPTSAPSSPYSSPALSPPSRDMLGNRFITSRGAFQTWSAPEMPHSDVDGGFSFTYGWSSERTASSIDSSPHQSSRGSSYGPPTSPTASALTAKISLESPMRWRENNTQVTVHPLPLPPGAAVSTQPSTPISPVQESSGASIPFEATSIPSVTDKTEFSRKPELMPIKSQWQKGKLIGRGSFGSVYVASNRETGALCAMKEVEILPDDSKSAECMRQLEQEIKILSRLKHPNIVQYFGSEIVGDKFYIYLEYVYPGSINKFIQDHCAAMTESIVRNFTRHILCGLAYLHSKKTIHRDIKGANLLVDAYGVVKLADFGTSKHLTGQAAALSLKGSPYWLAPEILQSATQKDTGSDLALAVDIWSLGCTIIEMMNGKPPWSEYEGPAALFRVLHETPPIPETLSDDGKDFLRYCFRRNPADRPTASKLLDHPFVNCVQQPDSSARSLKERRSSDNTQLLRERQQNRKLDKSPTSLDIQIKKGKLVNNEITQRNRHQIYHLTRPPIFSSRSTLDSLPAIPTKLRISSE